MTLPAPRLQMRWRKPTANELRRKSVAHFGDYKWTCVYELVIPLGEHDIRRSAKHPEKIVQLGRTFTSSSHPNPPGNGTPFREGAHAQWDSAALGGIPIYVIGADGQAYLQEPRKAA